MVLGTRSGTVIEVAGVSIVIGRSVLVDPVAEQEKT